MEPMMQEKNKSQVSSFIPYRKNGEQWEFFLQKRTADAPTSAGLIGLFGGSLENDETFEEGLIREVQEELVYTPTALRFFSRYETSVYIRHVYIEQVGQDFESKVQVSEGDYGKFICASEVTSNLQNFSAAARAIVPELAEALSKQSEA